MRGVKKWKVSSSESIPAAACSGSFFCAVSDSREKKERSPQESVALQNLRAERKRLELTGAAVASITLAAAVSKFLA